MLSLARAVLRAVAAAAYAHFELASCWHAPSGGYFGSQWRHFQAITKHLQKPESHGPGLVGAPNTLEGVQVIKSFLAEDSAESASSQALPSGRAAVRVSSVFVERRLDGNGFHLALCITLDTALWRQGRLTIGGSCACEPPPPGWPLAGMGQSLAV